VCGRSSSRKRVESRAPPACHLQQLADDKSGTMVPFFFYFWDFFMAFFCAFRNKGSSKTPKKKIGKAHVKNLWPKKSREKKSFSFRLFPSILFYRVFGRFSA
jgi:hypothetical protein